jgi:hypothetical protein
MREVVFRSGTKAKTPLGHERGFEPGSRAITRWSSVGSVKSADVGISSTGSEICVGEIVRLIVVAMPFAWLHASGFPEAQADDSEQGDESYKLSKPFGHVSPLCPEGDSHRWDGQHHVENPAWGKRGFHRGKRDGGSTLQRLDAPAG